MVRPENVLPILAVLLVHCGGTIAGIGDSGPPGEDAGPSGDAQVDAESPGCAGLSLASVNQACHEEGLQCELGSSDRWTCDSVLLCQGGIWDVSGPVHGCVVPACTVTSGTCEPGTPACEDSTASDTRVCGCVFGGPVMIDAGRWGGWVCSSPMAGCPALRPRVGATCTQVGQTCDYGVCAGPDGLAVTCGAATGTWVTSTEVQPCPF